MKVYIFGNGNISFDDFEEFYLNPLKGLVTDKQVSYIICDFRGVDTLAMEYLKSTCQNVTIAHIGERPRYIPDKYRTKVSQWNIVGGFEDDQSRDQFAIDQCTHFIARDFNSNEKRKSGTLKNIELCKSLGKIEITS